MGGRGTWESKEVTRGCCQVWDYWAGFESFSWKPRIRFKPGLACRGGSCQGVIWRRQMETSCSKISFLWVSERDCYMFRRLIFQRFLFQVKDNTLISIYKTVPQEAPWKNGFSDQRSRGNIAKSIPLYNLLYAAAHSSIWKAPAHHMVKKPI